LFNFENGSVNNNITGSPVTFGKASGVSTDGVFRAKHMPYYTNGPRINNLGMIPCFG